MPETTPEQIGIISEVGIGSRDVGSPVLWFTIHITEHTAALQVLSWDEAYEVLKTVRDVRDLEGKACWVQATGNVIKFQRVWSR
jgi:hypothetical protein